MKAQQQTTDILAPRPVHPRAIRHHGLFGSTFVNQHMVIDERWSAKSLIDEFYGMANLLSKRLEFNNLESKAQRKQLQKSTTHLRIQCRDGRTKLQNVLFKDNMLAIRNYLINYKDMQRLYQKMPLQMVVDNIDQRTFLMRKERDRLSFRLDKLKQEYSVKLLEQAEIENRIKFENEFILDEEIKMQEFLKKIENSNVRLRAIKTINSTYQKVIQILRHDEIFYEPILRSLSKDIDDQASFIKYILYMGIPALGKFKQLSEEYRQMEEKSRKSTHLKLQTVASFKKSSPQLANQAKTPKATELVVNMSKRYARETKNMLKLKTELEKIETIIKQVKEATLCSHAKEIFPRIKSQTENNFKLMKQNDIGHIRNDFLAYKEKVAGEQQNVLLHNYSEEEERRLLRIKELEEQIKDQDDLEEKTLQHIKTRADIFVILRYTLWNLSDILRYVERSSKVYPVQYPNTYLKLPLLKFDMLTMRACAPELFEENTKLLLSTVEKKVRTVMKAYKTLMKEASVKSPSFEPKVDTIESLWEEYHKNFLIIQESDEIHEDKVGKPIKPEEDVLEDTKTTQNVPNRKQIKMQSSKIVEEISKKEE